LGALIKGRTRDSFDFAIIRWAESIFIALGTFLDVILAMFWHTIWKSKFASPIPCPVWHFSFQNCLAITNVWKRCALPMAAITSGKVATIAHALATFWISIVSGAIGDVVVTPYSHSDVPELFLSLSTKLHTEWAVRQDLQTKFALLAQCDGSLFLITAM